MLRIIGFIAVLAGLAVAAPAAAATYYWASFEAEQAVENSDWGDARGVGSVDCAGKGAFKKQYSVFMFATFRCELKDSNYDRIGFVTVKTTGPESWRPVGLIPPRCPR